MLHLWNLFVWIVDLVSSHMHGLKFFQFCQISTRNTWSQRLEVLESRDICQLSTGFNGDISTDLALDDALSLQSKMGQLTTAQLVRKSIFKIETVRINRLIEKSTVFMAGASWCSSFFAILLDPESNVNIPQFSFANKLSFFHHIFIAFA